MNENQKTEVFQAQTTNVRELEKAWAHINRQINELLVRKNTAAVVVNTKLMALLYCALAEAVFSKLLHTPGGLTLDEIGQVKAIVSDKGVKMGWLKCAELALQRVSGMKNSHGHNVQQKLSHLIEQYIFDPSIVRNKLAHGQWAIALNRENTVINEELTEEIKSYTVVELYRRKEALQKLAAILEDIIESPSKAHPRDYWPHLVDLETKQEELAGWTLEKKIQQLQEKKAHRVHLEQGSP